MTAPDKLRTPLLALALLAPPAVASAQVTLTADAGGFNAYVWRGVTLTNRFVLQPDAYLTVPAGDGAFAVGGWASIEAGRYDDPASHLSEGGGRSAFDATEIDLWAEYGRALVPNLAGTLGGLVYLFPNEGGLTNDVNRTVEVYGKLQLTEVPLAPKLAAWYDVDKVNGLYLEGSVAQTVASIAGIPITLGALAGFSAGQGVDEDDPSEVANFAGDGLTHLDLSAGGALAAGPVTISPVIHLVVLNDDFTKVTRPGVTRDAKAWAGVTLTWSKTLTRAPETLELEAREDE